jgi:hypothetical protein
MTSYINRLNLLRLKYYVLAPISLNCQEISCFQLLNNELADVNTLQSELLVVTFDFI